MKHKALLIILAVALFVLAFYGAYLKKHQKTNPIVPSLAGQVTPSQTGSAEDFLATKKRDVVSINETATKTATAPKTDPCKDKAYDMKLSCFAGFYQDIVFKKSIPLAFADLKARYDTDPYVKNECHQLVHLIGRSGYKKLGSVDQAFVNGDPFCWSGYYHGVMEGVAQVQGLSAFDPEKIDKICGNIPGKAKYSFDYYNCVHGLGHGIMDIKYNNLFSSLTLCDSLTGLWEQSSCWGGVFMQNVIADSRDHKTAYLKPDDPLYPCNAVGDKYKNTCYLMQTSYMLKVANRDFAKVFALCSTVESGYVETCYQSLGRDASGQSISNKEQTIATCMLGKDYAQQANCMIGAVKDFIAYYHSDVQAKEVCAALTGDLQTTCTNTVSAYYTSFSNN